MMMLVSTIPAPIPSRSCGFFFISLGFPDGLAGKESACNAGDVGNVGVIPGSKRSPGEGHSNSLQYSCLENPMDRGAWWATVQGFTKSQTCLIDTHVHTHTWIRI